jgi:hypothetical protein
VEPLADEATVDRQGLGKQTTGRSILESRPAWALAFAVIAAIGLIFRIRALSLSFWLDEASSAERFFTLPTSDLISAYPTPNNHPLYSLAVNLLWKVSENEVTARLPSFLAWVGLVVLVFLIGKRAISEPVGWVAAMLTVLAGWELVFSIQARGYVLAAAFTTGAIYLLMLGLEDQRRSLVVWSALSLSLGAYAHLFSATVGVGIAIVWVAVRVRTRADLRAEIGPMALYGAVFGAVTWLLYLPSLNLAKFAKILLGRDLVGSYGFTEPQTLDLDYLHLLAGGLVAGSGSVFAVLAFVVPWVAGIMAVRKNRLGLALALIPLVVFAACAVGGFIYYTRFFFFVQPFVLIVAAAGILAVINFVRLRRAGAILAAVVVVVLTLGPRGGFPTTLPMQTRQWDAAAEYMLSSGLPIVANPLYSGWSPTRGAIGYYLDPVSFEEDPIANLEPGSDVFYVRLGGGVPETLLGVTTNNPMSFGR